MNTREVIDTNATAREMLPVELPGWQRQAVDKYRWKVPNAEDWITGTYVDPFGQRYDVHVSRWPPEYVHYVLDELYPKGKPTDFDVWIARGRFVYAVKILNGTLDQAKTLLAACPALSEQFIQDPEDG